MGMFDNKADLQAEVARLEVRVEMLGDENERLRKQVGVLQDAMVSTLAPMAYADMKAEESALEDGVTTKEEIERRQKEQAFARQYAAQIEQPFFHDANDMIEKLTAIMGGPQAAAVSVHGNEES